MQLPEKELVGVVEESPFAPIPQHHQDADHKKIEEDRCGDLLSKGGSWEERKKGREEGMEVQSMRSLHRPYQEEST